jgi:hypothetical protein
MLSNQINKERRSKYIAVLIAMLAIVFSLVPMYAFADTGTNTDYVRIKNSWKPIEYLYEKNGKVVYGSPAANDPASHWLVEEYNGFKRIKNRATGHYLNIAGHRKKGEGDYWNDPVKCGDWTDNSKGFLWTLSAQGGAVNISSALLDSFNIHVEDQNGSAQCSDVPAEWGSPQWLLEKASDDVAAVSPDANTNATSNSGSDTPAPSPIVAGGDLAFIYGTPVTSTDPSKTKSTYSDQSFIPWWELNTYYNKSFGEHSSVYLRLRVSGYAESPSNLTGTVALASYGYNYNINDQLSLAAREDTDGDPLADTEVLNNGYDWFYTFKASDGKVYTTDMHNSPFQNRIETKMTTTVLKNLNLTLAYAPENGNQYGPEQYLVKFKYSGKGFIIGGGYTNTNEGYANSYDQIRPTYALSGTLSAIPHVELYGEYLEHDYYLMKGSAKFDPFTLKVTYGDVTHSRIGNPLYMADTVDCELDYALSAKTKIITGVAEYVNTDHDGLALANLGLSTGPLTVGVQHDFKAEPLSPTEADDLGTYNPDMVNVSTLSPDTTRLMAKYELEGSNTLEAEYNLQQKTYFMMLHVGL